MSDTKFLHPLHNVCLGCDKHPHFCICGRPVVSCPLCKKEFSRQRPICSSGLCVFCNG